MIYTACHENDVWAHLTQAEIDAAARHGMGLFRFSQAHKHTHTNLWTPTEGEALRFNALGAVAEAAVCRALLMPIKLTAQNYGGDDVEGGIQVRLISHEHYGLRVLPGDKEDWVVVGVVITAGREREVPYRIPGWIKASDAKLKEWQISPNGRPPMYAVPQKALRSVRELIYDPLDDFAKSLDLAYSTIRDRKANGGPGWQRGGNRA